MVGAVDPPWFSVAGRGGRRCHGPWEILSFEREGQRWGGEKDERRKRTEDKGCEEIRLEQSDGWVQGARGKQCRRFKFRYYQPVETEGFPIITHLIF